MLRKLPQPLYKVCAAISLVLALFWGYKAIGALCKAQTDGFTVQGISSHRPFHPEWEGHPLSAQEREEVREALAQKYHYLARGNQAFAFLSEDGRYVIKFFNQKLFQPRLVWRYLPQSWLSKRRLKKIRAKEEKLRRDFSSYRLAFDALQEETGLILVHLNPTELQLQTLTLCDKIQVEHQIALDRFDFVLQKRAELVYPHIERLLARAKREEAKQALSSLLQLFFSRCQKGIADSDPDLDKNFGFIGNQAVQIDIGRFTRAHCREEVGMPPIKEAFHTWLSHCDAELFAYFQQEYAKLSEALEMR